MLQYGTSVPVRCVAALILLAVSVAGCTSSGPGKQRPSGSSSAPASSALVAPSSTPAPSTSSSSSAAPLSKFESDPGIRAYRAWSAEAARTVNSGHYTSAALRRLETPSFAKTMKRLLGTEVGRYYPGPIPFAPVNLVDPSATTKRSDGCVFGDGFAENRKTHKPAAAKRVLPVEVDLVYQGGRWLVNAVNNSSHTSCSGVRIGTPTW